jgi:protoporphyrinogen oxidase
VLVESPVECIELDRDRVVGIDAGGIAYEPDAVVSSLPLREVVRMARPIAPRRVLDAADGLRYRDFLTVALVVDGEDLFPDNWIYIHEPGVQVGRIQNFRSWSPWMVPDPTKACVGMEYFCFAGDDLWSMKDDDLVELAAGELERLRLAPRSKVERGYAIRVPKAYPIYDADYADRVQAIRAWLDEIENLQQVGRNGLHRYNNSDHSMLTAMRAVDNLLTGAHHDIWAVNAESVYHETHVEDESPYRVAPETPEMQALAATPTD